MRAVTHASCLSIVSLSQLRGNPLFDGSPQSHLRIVFRLPRATLVNGAPVTGVDVNAAFNLHGADVDVRGSPPSSTPVHRVVAKPSSKSI
jgi:hypothetical protein